MKIHECIVQIERQDMPNAPYGRIRCSEENVRKVVEILRESDVEIVAAYGARWGKNGLRYVAMLNDVGEWEAL